MGLCCRVDDSTYLIFTNRSPESVAGELKQYCESGDTFSVEHPNPAYVGALPEHARRWLARRAK